MSQTVRQPSDSVPPARRNRSERVGRDAGAVAARAFARAGFSDPALVLHWDDIVGREIARIARPLRLTQGATGGILTLKTEPAASVFLQHELRSLCRRINDYLGRPAVQQLRFVQGPLAASRSPRPIRRPGTAAPAGDPSHRFEGQDNLKSALIRLAGARRQPQPD